MIQEMFADIMINIRIEGEFVQIELSDLQSNEDRQSLFDISKRLTMPLEGFLQSFAVQKKFIQQLMDAGIVQKTNQFALIKSLMSSVD